MGFVMDFKIGSYRKIFVGKHLAVLFPLIGINIIYPVNFANAQFKELKFSYPAHRNSNMYHLMEKMVIPWTEKINKSSNGKLQIKIYPGSTLGTFAQMRNHTLNGVTDISFGFHAATTKHFKRSLLTALPAGAGTYANSLAFWHLLSEGLISEEYRNVHPLALWHFSAGAVHTKHKITSISDLKGKKIYAPIFSGIYAKEALGLTLAPKHLSAGGIYNGLSDGTVSGIVAPWYSILQSTKIADLTKFHLDVPLSMTPAFILMNKQSYTGLNRQARAALDKFSGEAFVKTIAMYFEATQEAYKQKIKKKKNNKIATLTLFDRKAVESMTVRYAKQEAKKIPGGEVVLRRFIKERRRITKSR